MILFNVKFNSNKGFFQKISVFKKYSQNGKKMPFLAFFWAFLVTYYGDSLFGPKIEAFNSHRPD